MNTAFLGDIATLTSGGTPDRARNDYYLGSIPWVTGADIESSGHVSARAFITEEAVAKSATNVAPPGAILLVTRTSVGKVGQPDRPTAFSQDITCIEPDERRVDSRYLVHFLRRSQQKLSEQARGATIKGVTRTVVERLELYLPAIAEQRRIAAVLDTADAVRVKQQRMAEHIERLNESIFVDMFGDLDPEPLGPRLAFVTSGGRGWAKYYAAAGEPFIRSLDVRFNRIASDELAIVDAPTNAEAKRTRTQAGDVLLTITGSRIGRAAPLPDELSGAYVSQHVAILRPKGDMLEPNFLSAFLCSPMFGQRQILASQYGQTKPGLNFEQIRRFAIPSVDLHQQLVFRDRVLKVKHTSANVRLAEHRLDNLVAGLQSRAFSGQL